jgi:thiol-disulfide isomerase/thioredoxin
MTFLKRIAPASLALPHRRRSLLNCRKILAAVTVLAFCCHFPPVNAAGQETTPSLLPDLTFRTYEDESIRTGDLKGDVVFVYLWAADCKSCLAARPAIEHLDKQFAVQGVWFLSVDEDANRQPWRNYLLHNPSPMTEVWDENHLFRTRVRLPKLPAAFAVDRSGQIRWRTPRWSSSDEAKASAQMASLLQEPKPK